MSGGHWDYQRFHIEDLLKDRIGRDGYAREQFPITTSVFRELGTTLGEAEKAMDWVLSADSSYTDGLDERIAMSIVEAVFRGLGMKEGGKS